MFAYPKEAQVALVFHILSGFSVASAFDQQPRRYREAANKGEESVVTSKWLFDVVASVALLRASSSRSAHALLVV